MNTVYQFVFYPYVNTKGEDVNTFLATGGDFKACELIMCFDQYRRPYLQGFVVLNKPMTPAQLRKAGRAPTLLVIKVQSLEDILDPSERMLRYEAVRIDRGGIFYMPEKRIYLGDKNVFDSTQPRSNDNPPTYTSKFLTVDYEP